MIKKEACPLCMGPGVFPLFILNKCDSSKTRFATDSSSTTSVHTISLERFQ
jgi:hypothetical protein